MKVLFVITGLGMGGAEHVVSNLADELVKLDHEVKIAYLTGKVMVSPKNPEVELIAIEMNSVKDFAKAYIKLRKLVKNFRPDVLHSHMFHSNIISRLLRLSITIPKVISTAHSNNEGGKSRMLAYRITDRLADISTNVSEQAVQDFISRGAVNRARIVTVVNGVNTDEFRFDNIVRTKLRRDLNLKNEKMILAVGRLDTAKDYPNLLNAITLLKNKRQNFKVFIAGDGPLRSELNKSIVELQLESFVELLGVRSDINEIMSAADIFVLSSAWEGFGLVVAEAMACKRYVIATDCGGVREIVGCHGILVEKRNSIALANKLIEGLKMSIEQRMNVGIGARKHIVDNYSLKLNVHSYLELYRS